MTQSAELVERIGRILKEEVGPALELDGSAIEVLSVSDGVAQVRLGRVCSGCPNTMMMVIHGLEQELRRRVPEIEYVEALP